MEEELISLKRALRSLVVSSPTTMTVSSLLKDYRNMVGGALPLTKFGYRDPIAFLKERCKDVFVLEGPPWDPILTPRITENLKHIDQMVQRQRVQSASKYKGKRRSVPGSIKPHCEPNMIARTFNIKREPPVVHREANIVAQVKVPEPKITQNKENYDVSRRQDISKQNSYKPRHEEYDTVCNTNNNDKENINNNSVVENVPSSALSKFYKKRLPQYNSDMDFPSAGADHVSNESPDSGRQSSSSQNSASKHVRLDELRTEILTLIKNSADGVWCTDLIRLYSETYGRELNYNRFGYTSIISFVYSMEDRVTITRPTPAGDWLLQDPSRVTAQRARGARVGPASALPMRRAPRYLSTRELSTDPDEALPGVDFEPDVFPADCLHYMDTIPAQPLGELCAGAQFEVLVGEVYSPSHFWILRVGDEHNMAMELIMDEMTEYYRGEGASRVLARGAIRVGQHCASVYDRDWHRALIVSIIDSDTVKVRHVDYGTVETVSVSSLKPLRREWGALAAQAVRARLAGCRPSAGGRRWPRASCSWFLNRVRDKRLYARLVALDLEEDILETFLTDTSGAEDMCLTRDLIRVGHADKRNDSALRTDECYLYPRFEALESGDTPNYADICRFLADGLSLEFVDAYRRHVPGPWTSHQSPRPSSQSAELARPLSRASLLSTELPRPLPRPSLPSAELARPPLRQSPSSAELPRPLLRPSLLSAELARPLFRPSLPFAEVARPPFRPSLPFAEVARPPFRPSMLPAEQARACTPLLVPPAPCAVSPAPDPPTPSPSPPPPEPPTADELPQPFELLNRVPLLHLDERNPVAWASLPVSPAHAPAPAPPELPPAERGLEVRLSEAEWAVLSHLRSTDSAAAHWYLLSTAWRVIVAPPGF